MPTACCILRDEDHYRHAQFPEGLKAAGFTLINKPSPTPTRDDVLLTWNRHGYRDQIAKHYELAGAKVIIAENGWIGRSNDGGKFYALCLSQHNGAGKWRVGKEDRFPGLNVELKPWRERGEYILVLPSRGIGSPGVRMPSDWTSKLLQRLSKLTNRKIRVREHPGWRGEKTTLEQDLAGAHCAIVWGSGAGIKAIAAGVPVFYELPGWIGALAAGFGIDALEQPFLGDRMPMFRRLAWAQFSAAEIATGWPIRHLLAPLI